MQTAHQNIRVTLKVFGGLRDAMGKPTMLVELRSPASLADLLDALAAMNPIVADDLRRGLEAGYLNVLINGRIIPRNERGQRTLEDQDAVAFLPPVGGG